MSNRFSVEAVLSNVQVVWRGVKEKAETRSSKAMSHKSCCCGDDAKARDEC